MLVSVFGLARQAARAHDLERTQVSIAFARDGSFVLDVANDANWLLLRLEPFADSAVRAATVSTARDERLRALSSVFVDRVVLFVDGHEVRPMSVEYVPPRGGPAADDRSAIAMYRLRGRVGAGARGLRWFYGLVIDPYPLTVRKANGQSTTRWVAEAAWSAPIDLAGTFQPPRLQMATESLAFAVVLGILLLGLKRRSRTPARHTSEGATAGSASIS